MKKLLVILMVVAMASFLFVGCVPTTPVTPVEPVEPVEPVVPVVTATVAPIITAIPGISLTSAATQYINAIQAAVVTVTGTAPTYSEVKVYVDDVCAGTADVGETGTFTVVVAEADLGADGDKVIYATAKEAALDVSAHSVEYEFVLDQVKPGFSIAATAYKAAVAATATTVSGSVTGTNPLSALALGGTGTVVAGDYKIEVLALQDGSTPVNNVTITTPAGTSTAYTVPLAGATFTDVIPGVVITFKASIAAGWGVTITNTATGTASTVITSRATITFDEDVSTAGMIAGIYDWGDPAIYKEATDTGYWESPTPAVGAKDDIEVFSAYGFKDLAGNIAGTLASPITDVYTVGAASLYTLVP